jgi:hypothetical protein
MGNLIRKLFESLGDIESEEKRINDRISKLDPNLSPQERKEKEKEIKVYEKKITLGKKKKKVSVFNPVSLFVDRTPKELDERVKKIVREKLKENPKMSDEELTQLISETTIVVVNDLASECQEEYKIAKIILSPKYGNGKWPTKKELEKLINEKNFPWPKTQINIWPEEKDITSCSVLMTVKDKIMMNNLCIYSDNYNNIIQECDAECGKGLEIRSKKVLKETNSDFPTIQPCSVLQKKEFECDSGKICKEDCKIEIDFKSFGEAKCSKPCDSGDGPGEKTYKIKYLKSSKGGGSCDLDETDKKEGESYDITVPCNSDKCPACQITSKGPYKDDTIDYTKSVVMNGKTVPYTACLLPKEDGTFKNVDCGGAEGGFNYTKGARSKYSVMYNVTEDDYGVQNCTVGESTITEACPVNAFTPNLQPIVKDGKILKGGGEPCGDECVLSEDYPRLVCVNGKECSKECGGGKKRMRKIVKAKGDAPYCPCKNDPSKCPFEEVDCNTEPCIADCEYANNGKHVQINDYCPGVQGGVNQDIVWDTKEDKWYDPSEKKYYPRNHFMKHMRVPTKKPPIGKGLCYQGDKADRHLNCSIESNDLKRPIDGEWGPWEFNGYVGENTTLQSILPEYKKWDDPSNPNLQSKIEKRIQDRIAVQEKDPVTGETLTEDRIREEENHCVSEENLLVADLPLPGIKYTRELKKLEDGNPGPRYGGKPAPGPFTKTVPYMKKPSGDYTRYCPIDQALVPEYWFDRDWDEDKCYVEGRAYKGGNVKNEKYTVKELEEEATKSFTRDVNLPEYSSPRTGEKRIIGPGTRTIFRFKERDDTVIPEKYGGLPSGKWHTVTNGMTSDKYDKRNEEYDECDGVRQILKEIKEGKTDNWKANTTYVIQKSCKPVYDWDGKYYTSATAAEDASSEELIRTHTDTGRVELSKTEKGKYPYSGMRKTTNGKFLTNSMHPDCQKPGLNSNTAWCGSKSTDDFIQMVTVSEGIEMIKGVVTKGRGNNEQWVETFEVYVSRNGDSWKQVKNASGSTTFTGNTKDTRNTAVKNYFKNRVEAKYIRFVTKTWEGHNSMRIGYIEDLSGTVDCKGGDGLLQKEPWYRLTFNEAKTKESGNYSEGKNNSVCPPDNTPLIYQRGSDPVTGFEVNNLNINGTVSELKSSMTNLTTTTNFPGCGKDAKRVGWRNSSSGASFSWTDCYKEDSSGAQTTNEAVCVDDKGFQYMYNYWNSFTEGPSEYKPWTPNKDFKTISPSDKVSHLHNVRRKECFRKKCHVLPKYTTEIWTSTHAMGSGGNKSKIMNLADKGTDGFVKNTAYSWPFFNNSLLSAVAKHWDINVGYSTDWIMNNYKIQELEGCCDGMDNKNSWDSNWRGRSITKIGGARGWHSVNLQTKNLIHYKLNWHGTVGHEHATQYCQSRGLRLADKSDIDDTYSKCAGGWWKDGTGYYRGYKMNYTTWGCGSKGWNVHNGDYTYRSHYCAFDGVKKNRTDNEFVYFRFNLENEIQTNGSMIPVGIKIQPMNHGQFKIYWPGSIRIDELDKTITLPTPSNKDQIFLYTFSHDDREILKNGNIHIYPSASTHIRGHVSIRTNLLYGVDGEGHSIEKINI